MVLTNKIRDTITYFIVEHLLETASEYGLLKSSLYLADAYLKSDTHPSKKIVFLFALMIALKKRMKNGFYLILKALFILKIFKLLS